MMPECLQALTDGEVHTLSLGFAAENGHLICLCLMNETTCLSIDRTILSKTDYLRNMIEFKELFEGSCTLVGVDIWELMFVLYIHYAIKCTALADVDVLATEDAGDTLPSSNYDVHLQVARKALQVYDTIAEITTRLLSVQTIPPRILNHICELNTKMRSVYKEVREKNIEVVFSRCPFNNAGTACRITCEDYNSRIRSKSLVHIDFGELVLAGRCLEWDCRKTGKIAEVALENHTDKRNVRKIMVNRRRERLLQRVLLRHLIHSLCRREFELNVMQKHFYCEDPLVVQDSQMEDFKKVMVPSQRLNKQQNLAFLKSLFPVSVIHGPPGTGKTRTLSEIGRDAVRKGQGVLCICWTNVAVLKLYEELRNVLPANKVGIITSAEYKCWHESECEA